MKTKIIAQEAPTPPAEPRVYLYEMRRDEYYEILMVNRDQRVTCIASSDPERVGYAWITGEAFGELNLGSFTRIDGPITIQFNAP